MTGRYAALWDRVPVLEELAVQPRAGRCHKNTQSLYSSSPTSNAKAAEAVEALLREMARRGGDSFEFLL